MNQDPSMEEILASIKRVIAEDARPAPAARSRSVRAVPEPPPAPEDDVLELSDPVTEEDGLASEQATAVARQSLAALSALKQAQEPDEASPRAGDGPLEAVVRDMLRPLLKDWLDQRLPELVEDMVAREIARITGKGL